MDRLTFELIAAHHPRRIVLDYDGDLWHAECMASDRLMVHYGLRRGPDKLETYSDGSKEKCWLCGASDAEPWTC